MKTYVSSKIHGIRVTDKSVQYHGSVTICRKLMEQAQIDPYEQVHVIDLNNGSRWVTYALPGPDGVFTLNGGGARLGEVGDPCVVIAYQTGDRMTPAPVVFVGPGNVVEEQLRYENP